MIGVPVLVAQRKPALIIRISRQKRLGKRRPFQRQPAKTLNDRDLTIIPVLAKGFGTGDTGMAAPDNHDTHKQSPFFKRQTD